MSSAGRAPRGGEGRDFFQTPPWCVHRLLEACPLPGGIWLEPAVGDGAIVNAVDEIRCDVDWITNDLVGQGHYQENFLRLPIRVADAWDDTDVIITNPPYYNAHEFVRVSLGICPIVAMLLRLSWLEGAKRSTWLRCNTPSVYVLPNRPSFTADGKTDSAAYAWMVWGMGRPEVKILADTPRELRR